MSGLGTLTIIFDALSADPGGAAEGWVWFNSTDNAVKYHDGTAVRTILDNIDLSDHVSASNPHTVTLEQARTAGATLAGAIAMGTNKITGLATPTVSGDAAEYQWVLDQINSKLRGMDWQESVLDKDLVTAPGGPTTGDRYIIAGIGGAWSTFTIGDVVEWDGTQWLNDTPNEGYCARVMDENKVYIHDGTSWGLFEASLDHGSLLGKGDDDHTQYLLVAGTRAMSGNLDMGTNAITNVGNVDGVDVSGHAARHNPGSGTDAIATAAAVELTDATNAEGTASSVARSDHTHAHGNRGGGSLHALMSASQAGFYPQSNLAASADPVVGDDNLDGYSIGSRWLNTTTDEEFVCLDAATGAAVWKSTTDQGAVGGYLVQKAGKKLAADFTGTPMKATVTFGAAFADADYSVALALVTANGKSFAPYVESPVAGSFVICLGSNSKANLTEVHWTATKHGEST